MKGKKFGKERKKERKEKIKKGNKVRREEGEWN